ncbi:phosphopyruvate hydratase [Humibacillus sp. DSM 29435]|uniref:phosphopyruvate hydratase n=1 Tax=Humibacillus sp. DSM 29435 TaxID=1869167 RepID=UPI0008723E8D|nr:phosphopyruvate hydratase [Humibacillus sp. DSM 29435]OFE15269.1 phosphopyruvate hydratase [Humibacillus sp. DSM 29435]
MSFEIASLSALEILDSRSRPTLSVTVELAGGPKVSAGVPSGASTGTREAVELRDGDPARFSGAGVSKAVGNVNGEIAQHLLGRSLDSLVEADEAMQALDGTPNKARLGANAIVGVSMALARALAAADGQPLHAWLPGFGQPARLPVPCFNVLNGGVHAPNPLDFQEFMVCPLGAPSMAEAVRSGAEVYAALRKRLVAGGHATGLGDEGGFAPDLTEPEDVLAMIVAAIEDAGYTPGTTGVAIALDPAASEFRQHDGTYRVAGQSLSSTDLVERYAAMVAAYPIWSIEDGLGESDHSGWQQLTARLGDQIQLVGDDNFCTNPAIIAEAISDGIANAALIKLNQIGTVSETLEAMAVCHRAGYAQMVSHRSGETPDTFIADLAVATGCGQIKTGAPARGERVAKYNRLIEIAVARPDLPFGRP